MGANVNVQTNDGFTPLTLAIEKSTPNRIKKLMDEKS